MPTLMLAGHPLLKALSDLRIYITVALFLLLFGLLYPQYRYILDDDGVAYATITRRWAEGDFFRAINGLWSPLHCWLAVPFYKAGLPLADAFRWSNAAIGISILLLAHAWLQAFGIAKHIQAVALLVMLPFVLYLSFFQLAADNLFCLVFLFYVKLCSHPDACSSNSKIIAIGFVGSGLYLAKAYGFLLFVLHFTLWQVWLCRSANGAAPKAVPIRNLLLGLGVFMIGCLPWIIALWYKYGFWTISLHVDYGLVPYLPVSSPALIPPPWPDSPTQWEDPFIHQTIVRTAVPMQQFWVQLPKEIAHNAVQGLHTLNRFSFLGVALLAALIVYALQTKNRRLQLCVASMLLLPLGYLFLHIEARFLWPLFFLLLICSTKMLQEVLGAGHLRHSLRLFCWVLFFSGFLLTPVDDLQNMLGKDQKAYRLANLLRRQKLTGKIASNEDYSFMRQVAFYAGNQYYESGPASFSSAQLMPEIKKLELQYFYFFYKDKADLQLLAQARAWAYAYKTWKFEGYNLVVIGLKN